jgi:hypothetical protein
MKRTAIFFLAAAFSIVTSAQNRTTVYMTRVPVMPNDSCNVTRAKAEAFEIKVDGILQDIEADIDMLTRLQNTTMENNASTAQETAMKQLSQQYGISQADLERMKNAKNMSAAEKQALANKMMQQQTNMSMGEVQNLSKMSDAGKKAYAEAYATESMAVSETDPAQQARNANARTLYESLNARTAAMNKISATQKKITDLYSSVETDPERQAMLDRMDAWHARITSMAGVDYGQGKQMDSLALLITNEQIKYCDRFTPRYRGALRQHMQILKASLPDYKSYGEIMDESNKLQTGISTPPECREIASLSAIADYLRKLKGVYSFKLHYPEDSY